MKGNCMAKPSRQGERSIVGAPALAVGAPSYVASTSDPARCGRAIAPADVDQVAVMQAPGAWLPAGPYDADAARAET